MRQEVFVEPHPESAMYEDDQTFRPAVRQEEVEAIAWPLAIGDVDFRPSCSDQALAIGLRRFNPCRRPALSLRNIDAVGVGIVPIVHPPMDQGRTPVAAPYSCCIRCSGADVTPCGLRRNISNLKFHA